MTGETSGDDKKDFGVDPALSCFSAFVAVMRQLDFNDIAILVNLDHMPDRAARRAGIGGYNK